MREQVDTEAYGGTQARGYQKAEHTLVEPQSDVEAKGRQRCRICCIS